MLAVLLTTACSQADVPRFTPPAERPVGPMERPWPANRYAVLAYHDVEDGAADQRYMSVRTSALNEQFAWLKQNGYQPVSVEQILQAQNGGPALPNKAVLLTFDDGYRSFYSRVFPLLKAYNWPAVLAPVGVWLDAPAGKPVDFGGLMTPRDRFLTWQQVREVSDSGLVEIGAHTYASHYGGIANPQGNTEPAVANRLYDAKRGRYESEAEYRQRIEKDVALITQRITAATGKAPRVWVWPYGAAGGVALDIARKHGYRMALTLENGLGDVNAPANVPRMLVAGNPSLTSFAQQLTQIQNRQIMRVAHVDLDYLYDPDPQQQAKNLDKLIQRIYDLRINTVFLQAFADPKGDGNVRELYFPNRWLPMKADLFNRVSWQLSSRTGVAVYAWMPVLAFELGSDVPRVQRLDPQSGQLSVDDKQYRRLSPFNPVARQRIGESTRIWRRTPPLKDPVPRRCPAVGLRRCRPRRRCGLPPGRLRRFGGGDTPGSAADGALDALQEPGADRVYPVADRAGAGDPRPAGANRAQHLCDAGARSRQRSLVRPEPGGFPAGLRLGGADGDAADGKRVARRQRPLAGSTGGQSGRLPRRAR